MKIGDWVRIIDDGDCYFAFESWAEKNSLEFWENGLSPEKFSMGKIIAMDKDGGISRHVIYGVRIKNRDYIMDAHGIEVIFSMRDLLKLIGD